MILIETFIDGFDAHALQAEENSHNSRRVKREWIEKGYVNQLSFYGALKKKATGNVYGVRIEVHSKTPYTKDDLTLLHDIFTMATPDYPYSIWAYDSDPLILKLMGKYERTWKRF